MKDLRLFVVKRIYRMAKIKLSFVPFFFLIFILVILGNCNVLSQKNASRKHGTLIQISNSQLNKFNKNKLSGTQKHATGDLEDLIDKLILGVS